MFIIYNQQRTNNNNFLPKSLLDKCLLFNLESFQDEPTNIPQITHGFLINLKMKMDINNTNIIYDIASSFSKMHKCLKKKENDDYYNSISECTLINYYKTLKKENLPLSMKESLLYFYFPSLSKDIKEGTEILIEISIL